MSPLPAWANSGQYVATGASKSSRPRWASRWAHAAVAPFVDEKTNCSVSAPYGTVPASSKAPPQTSTTLRPSTWTQRAGADLETPSKFASNASRTPSKPGSTLPVTSVIGVVLTPSTSPWPGYACDTPCQP